jgi:hypothetical protein
MKMYSEVAYFQNVRDFLSTFCQYFLPALIKIDYFSFSALLNQEESPKLVSQLSGILLQMAKHSMPNETIGQFKLLTQEIAQRHPSNFKLMELIGVLLSTPGEFDDICSESWVMGLVEVLKSGTATSAQRQVAKQLLKRSNKTFMKLLPQDWNYSLIGSVK